MNRANLGSHPPPRSARMRTRARRLARGFTLIELTVALVAGLIVALAVASLSREATATFHEEVRMSAAEAGLRAAADRLRADLARASYMSTPNVQVDPALAKLFGQANNLPNNAPASLRTFQGIRFYAGSLALNARNNLTLDTTPNNVMPASIDITGNMSSSDQFEVQSVAVVGQCCKISLVASSPAIFRMMNSNDAGAPDGNMEAEMQAIFAPVPPTGSDAFTQRQFWVRYVDLATNHSQYLLTCPSANGGQVAGMGLNAGTIAPYVYVVGPSSVCPLTGADTGTVTGSNGNAAGLATVNPVQTVRWEIVNAQQSNGTAVPAQDTNALDNLPLGGQDPNKYDLVRSLVDMSPNSTGAVIPESTEVIAEYAIDLDFAFSVDTGDTTGTAPTVVSYDFGDPINQQVADTVATAVPIPGPLFPDPQRIRSVRFRLATRAAQADRPNDIPVQSVADGGGGTFLYRYCLPVSPATSCVGTAPLQWARVRTLVGEVSIPNQQQAFF